MSPAREPQGLSGSTNSGGSTLIFGDGDDSDGLSDPLEPLENLRQILNRAGDVVSVKRHLPRNLGGIQTIWFVGIKPLSQDEQNQLVGFVKNGGGLYLTGERVCCEAANRADEAIIDRLANLRPSRVGDGADVDGAYIARNTVNTNAIDGVGQLPARLSTWQPSAPGVLSGLTTRNALTFAYQGGVPVMTGEVWDGSELVGGRGRLAILMDVNWLESSYWEPASAQGMALDLQRFLHGGDYQAQPLGDAYVALGDSYSSGEGNPRFEPYTDHAGGDECHRSEEPNGAYPLIVERDLGNPSFAFVACSGATTGNIWSGPDPPQGKSRDPEPLQIGSLSNATRVVTLTVGGDDVGFAKVLSTCIWHATQCSADGIRSAPPILRNAPREIRRLQHTLELTYKEIRRFAPHAHIFVLGYPDIFPKTAPDADSCFFRTGLEHTSIEWLTERQTELTAVVQKAASNAGVTWVNPNSGAHSFIGHDICASASWFNSILNRSPTHYSFHPTKVGQENLAATLVADGVKKGLLSGSSAAIPASPAASASASPTERLSTEVEADPEDARLAGTVTDAGGSGVAGVQVYIDTIDGSYVAQGETGPDGTYSIEGLAAGSYKVEFYPLLEGYEPQWWDGKSSESGADAIDLAAGQSVGHVDAHLTADATISGVVSAAGGQPLAGVAVQAESMGGGPSGYAETAADGTYTVAGLNAGPYRVEFFAEGYEAQWYAHEPSESAADEITLGPGENATGVDATLEPEATLSGRVTASDGEPLAGVEVYARQLDGGGFGSAATDEHGEYLVEGLPAGEYTVEFEPNGLHYAGRWYDEAESEADADPISLTSGEVKAGVDATMVRTAAEIKGRVTDAHGEPLSGLEVVVSEAGGTIAGIARTSADGTYAVDGLQAGVYTVEFEPGTANLLPQLYDEQGSASSATPVPVAADSVVGGIDAVMQPGATISGTVSAAGGTPLGGVEVSVYDQSGAFLQDVASEGDGTYAISGLPAGTYTVGFEPIASNYVGQLYDDASESAAATPIVLAPGASKEGVDAHLAAGATVEGTVTEADGNPVEDVEVHLEPTGGGPGGSAITEDSGRYSVIGLRPGDYTVQFVPTDGNYASIYFGGKPEAAEAEVITLSADSVRDGVDAVLSPGAGVAGTVTDQQTHAPVAGVQVSIEPAEEAGQPITTTTGEDGSFSVSGLPAGKYVVAYEPDEANYIGQYFDGAAGFGSASPISLSAGMTVEGVDAALTESATISGEITAAKAGAPIAEAAVYVESADGDVIGTATTGADGSYAVTGLPPGSYTVEFSAEGQNYLNQLWDGQSEKQGAQSLTLTPGERRQGIDASLAGGSRLAGTVTDAGSGQPVGGVEVFAQAVDGGADAVGTTGADGTYSITGLPPGSYEVQFEPIGSNDLVQWYDDASSAAEAEQITLAAEASRNDIDAALATGSTVSGTVTEAQSGEPLAGIEVDAYTSACDGSGGTTTTDSSGHYEIQGIAAGSYHLVFDPDGGSYAPELYSREISLAASGHEGGVDASLTASPGGSAAFTPDCAEPQVPVSTSPPTISGTAIVGQALSEAHGSWLNGPASYAYRWERCNAAGSACDPIAGATSQAYTLAPAELGSTIRVQETASNGAGAGAPALSAPTAVVQEAAPAPPTPAPGSATPEAPAGGAPASPAAAAPSPPAKKKACKKGKRRRHGRCVKKARHKRRHKRVRSAPHNLIAHTAHGLRLGREPEW